MTNPSGAASNRRGFIRLALLLSAVWATLVLGVGALESQTKTRYTALFETSVQAKNPDEVSDSSPGISGQTTGATTGRRGTLNPDDYFGPMQTWAFDLDKFVIVLLAPIAAVWLFMLAVVPGIRWVVRGFTQ